MPSARSSPGRGRRQPVPPVLGKEVEPLSREHRERVDLVRGREQDLVGEPASRIDVQLDLPCHPRGGSTIEILHPASVRSSPTSPPGRNLITALSELPVRSDSASRSR